MRGLGDDGFDIQEGGSYVPPSDYNPTQQFGTFFPPSSGTSNWANYFQGLTTQGLNLVGKIVAPTATYVRNADGSLSISAPASGNVNPFATVPTSVSGNSLLYIGLAVGAVLLIGAVAKK